MIYPHSHAGHEEWHIKDKKTNKRVAIDDIVERYKEYSWNARDRDNKIIQTHWDISLIRRRTIGHWAYDVDGEYVRHEEWHIN